MAKSSFYEKDMGYNKFMHQMEVNAGKDSVFSGFTRSSGAHKGKGKQKSPITMAQLGAVHEFGSADGRIPERSYMRSAVAAGADKLRKLAKKLSVQVTEGKMDKKKALGVLGQAMVDMMRSKIRESVPPPNAKSTIEAKGSSKTLIDTGQLMGALDWEIQKAVKK